MRKTLDVIIISVFFLMALAGCAGEAESPLPLIKIRSNGSTGEAPIYIALAEGYFTEQGLNVELVTINRTSESIAALIRGDIDIISSPNQVSILNTITKEEGIKVVADRGHISKESCTYHGVVIQKELYDNGVVTSPVDFVNNTIQSSSGVGIWLTTLYIDQAGLTLDDLEITDLPSSAVIDSLANQTIVASTIAEPRLSEAVNSGVAVKVAGLEDFVDDFQLSVLTYGKRLLSDNRDLGLRFMLGYLKGVKQFNEGKTPRNLEIISQYTEIPQEDLAKVCWPPIYEDGRIHYKGFMQYQEWAVNNGDLEAIVPEEIYWDSYFVEEAYRLLNE